MQVDDLAIWMLMRNRDRPKGSRCHVPVLQAPRAFDFEDRFGEPDLAATRPSARATAKAVGMFADFGAWLGSRGTCCARLPSDEKSRPHRSSQVGHDTRSSRNMDVEAPPSVSGVKTNHTSCPDASAGRDVASGGAIFRPSSTGNTGGRFGMGSVKDL